MKPTKVKLHRSHGVFLDPEGAGSTIQWVIDVTGRPPNPDAKHEYQQSGSACMSVVMRLSDCSRSIEWEFRDCDSSLDKIDRAIMALTKFRRSLVWARTKTAALRSKYDVGEDDDE